MSQKLVILGADHGGFALKQEIAAFIAEWDPKIVVEDLGCYSEDRVDYPDFSRKVAQRVCKDPTAKNPNPIGILFCGTGIGISIAANKFDGVRCALCHDTFSAKMAREHNNANILALGGRVLGVQVAKDMVKTFLSTAFENDPRHSNRIALIHSAEVKS